MNTINNISKVENNSYKVFNENPEKFREKLIYMIENKKDYLECNFKKKIKLKKNIPLIINFNRCYDLYSDLIFEYERGVKIDNIKLNNLPNEINCIIKSYLTPKCNVDIFLGQGFRPDLYKLKKAEEIYNDDKSIVKKKRGEQHLIIELYLIPNHCFFHSC